MSTVFTYGRDIYFSIELFFMYRYVNYNQKIRNLLKFYVIKIDKFLHANIKLEIIASALDGHEFVPFG